MKFINYGSGNRFDFTTNNNRGGDVIIQFDWMVLLVISAIIAMLYLGYRGLMNLTLKAEIAADQFADQVKSIHENLTDPIVWPYVVAIMIIVSVLVLCMAYLINRFDIINAIQNQFFNEEEDHDW